MKNVKLERRHLETDVLIIGGGTAGCYAAIKLGAQKDLRVLVVEKANIERSGCLAAGVNALNAYISNGHTPADYVEYARRDAEGIIRDDLMMTIAESVNGVTEDLEHRGLVILKDEAGNYVTRGWRNVKINGENIKPLLAKGVREQSNVTVLNHVNITDLKVADGTVHGAIRDLEVRDVDVVEHGDVALLAHPLGQERLDVLAVDLDVAPAARDVVARFILEDHKAAMLEIFGDSVDRLRDRHHEVIADDALGISACILDVVGRRVAVRDVGVECIDAGCETAAALDIGLLNDEHAQVFLRTELDCSITAGRAAADDEHIRFQMTPFQLHILHTISP